MKNCIRHFLYCVFTLMSSAAVASEIPLDQAGFTAYIQQRLQLYSPASVKITGPFSIAIGTAQTLNFKTLHDDCVHDQAKCPRLADAFVQQTAHDLQQASSNEHAAPVDSAGGTAVPGDEAGFMAYLVGEFSKAMPAAKFESDGFTLRVTRGAGRPLNFNQKGNFDVCQARGFRCGALVANYVSTMRDWLTLPDTAQMRIVLHVMASCNVVASVGNSLGCRIVPPKEPLAPFFRRAFANLEELCFKKVPSGGEMPMTNADRRDLDMDIGTGVERCEQGMHAALAPLPQTLKAAPSAVIGVIAEPYASSRAVFAQDWAPLAVQTGGHLVIAVPTRDTLLYMKGDGPTEVATLGARAMQDFQNSPIAVSSDVYRWNGDGWILATEQSTMAAGPRQSTDVLPHLP